MILHAGRCMFYPLPPQHWRGLRPLMQVHEKRHRKRAGEAGVALRARHYLINFIFVPQSAVVAFNWQY
ncbi:hypothetical protein D9B68_08925 [Serratia marcescens]|nr:hypothetical protein D9B68_08925 [Serratia marcescens]RTG46945.1 hypothetical protein D9B61_18035 [Serratia marcescens]RTG66046.1 hypothetical protein D9B59_09220 [Serratia marcescens]